ncbi:MAG: argininosuccinate lyase [Hyphomicrobiaceae bacterium]|nr:argininosuccinate lyase [Hyphomicrobiaceae bacterium]
MSNEIGLRERVREPPCDRLVESYYRPNVARALAITFDHEMWIHLAHVLMLGRQGIVAQSAVAAILGCILDLAEGGPDMIPVDDRAEDMYSYVEREIVRRLGADVGGRLHTGRSRNDLHTSSARMALRGLLIENLQALAGLRTTTLDLADRHAETVMPGYTHAQHAQPVTFGYWMLAVADVLARDHRRLTGALLHADLCPLGSGALTTTAFPLDRIFTSEALGFAAPLDSAYDGVASRDDALEAISACATLMTGLSRVAADLQAWSTWEYGFVELADRHSAVSSIMPQKKNPAALEHIKAAAGITQGLLMATMACMKNTAFADVNDGVSAINEPVYDACQRTCRICLLLTEVLQGLTLNPDRMLLAATKGFGSATELADVIVRESGLSFRTAHNIVASVVREALEHGRTADQVRSQDLDAASQALLGKPLGLPQAVVTQALDPAANIRVRTILGGPAPSNMRMGIASRRAALAADASAIAAIAERIGTARMRVFGLARAARA